MKILVACFLVLPAISCYRSSDFKKERAEIIALLNMERKAHFEKNVTLFMSEFSDSMISVNRGVVTVGNNDQRRRRIQEYFNSVDFIKWDDVVPPKISFAEEGTMAYAVVQKQVIISHKDNTERARLDTTDFAWVAIYRKTASGWKIECNVSTNR